MKISFWNDPGMNIITFIAFFVLKKMDVSDVFGLPEMLCTVIFFGGCQAVRGQWMTW